MPGSGASGLQRFMVVTRNVLRTVTYSHATPKGEPFAYLKVQGSSPNILLPTSTSPQLLTKSQRSTQAQYVQSQSSNYQIHTKSAISKFSSSLLCVPRLDPLSVPSLCMTFQAFTSTTRILPQWHCNRNQNSFLNGC
jgi:hypothetical protein